MSTSYKTLARLFHADRSGDSYANHNALAKQRLEADSTYRTGVVTAMGELFIAMPRELTNLLASMLLAERKIAVQWNQIPGVMQWNYINHAISEELFATNEMEGVRSTRKEVEEAVAAAREQQKGVKSESARFNEFAKLYLNLTDQSARLPQTLEDIRSIYDRIALDEIAPGDRPDGELFRTQGVEIQGNHGEVVHSGVDGEGRINVMLAEMMRIAETDSMPSVLAAIAAHFLFEYIHPFYDGNGRTGRYLLALYLNRDLTMPTVLSLSRVIAENKSKYYKAFSEVEDKLNCGEMTFFVQTMIGLISQAQQELIDELGIKVDRLGKARSQCERLTEQYGLSQHAGDLLFQIMQEELFDTYKAISLDEAADNLQLGKQSTRKYVSELEQTGLIAFTGRRPLRMRASQLLLDSMDR